MAGTIWGTLHNNTIPSSQLSYNLHISPKTPKTQSRVRLAGAELGQAQLKIENNGTNSGRLMLFSVDRLIGDAMTFLVSTILE